MVRLSSERILLIGDADSQVRRALSHAVPSLQVTDVATIFDGIAELCAGGVSSANGPAYTAVLAAAEPIERRPEAAVRALRDLAGNGRLVLFGPPEMEVLSRKMLQFGCDDYLLLPANPREVRQLFSAAPLKLTPAPEQEPPPAEPLVAPAPAPPVANLGLPQAAELFLDALLEHPQSSATVALKRINEAMGPLGMQLVYETGPDSMHPQAMPADGWIALSQVVTPIGDKFSNDEPAGTLHLLMGHDADQAPARQFLSHVAHLLGKTVTLQDRHQRLQKLAITDELTGLYNGRYFRHFLKRITEKARQMHFAVTLLLFDIDDFKKYNDQYGHGVGDDILRQTAQLMKRCSREHDLVARIGGDEFAVVFWDKEGPRQSHQSPAGASWRPPQTPIEIFKRFQKLIASEEFPVLGQSGKGVLGISAGMAVFPWEAQDVASLIQEADRRLMQLAKKCGKNTIYIVGEAAPGTPI